MTFASASRCSVALTGRRRRPEARRPLRGRRLAMDATRARAGASPERERGEPRSQAARGVSPLQPPRAAAHPQRPPRVPRAGLAVRLSRRRARRVVRRRLRPPHHPAMQDQALQPSDWARSEPRITGPSPGERSRPRSPPRLCPPRARETTSGRPGRSPGTFRASPSSWALDGSHDVLCTPRTSIIASVNRSPRARTRSPRARAARRPSARARASRRFLDVGAEIALADEVGPPPERELEPPWGERHGQLAGGVGCP